MTSTNQETCWTLIRAAAAGEDAARTSFARRYLVIVRRTIASRWRGSHLQRDLDDAVQEVFVECFRKGGAIERADPSRRGDFRSYLIGVIHNVAARFEVRAARLLRSREPGHLRGEELPARERSLSKAFDREWARSIVLQAGAKLRARAKRSGAAADRRLQILRFRFDDGLPVRDIAAQLGIAASVVHHEYAYARKEFKAALREVVAFHHPGSDAEIDRECLQLLELLK